jgi:pimeloyl-ACP methyl ester carboxylesterase
VIANRAPLLILTRKGFVVEASTYVLIPGAWHGAWCWRPVAERLRAAGHRAVALTLPGLGDGDDPAGHRLQDAVDFIVDEVRRRDLDNVTFVAHSWGAYPSTGAAHLLGNRVSKVVFYNGVIPEPGKSAVDDAEPAGRDLLLQMIAKSPSGSVEAAPEFVEQLFLPGEPPELQRLVGELLSPQPGGYFLDVLDAPDVITLGIATAYIVSENNHQAPRSGQAFAARLGVEPIVVPGTHNSMLTHPDEVTEAILTA